MPEYHQIQTYAYVNHHPQEIIVRCVKLFEKFGWLNSKIHEWLSNAESEIEKDGFGSILSPILSWQLANEQINVRFEFIEWTSKIVPALISKCIEFTILFESTQLDDLSKLPSPGYKDVIQTNIWQIMQEVDNAFPDNGVFFTDEAQAGKTWWALIEKDFSKIWQFECAIIPEQYKASFLLPNPEYSSNQTQSQLWLARKPVWENPPWEEIEHY